MRKSSTRSLGKTKSSLSLSLSGLEACIALIIECFIRRVSLSTTKYEGHTTMAEWFAVSGSITENIKRLQSLAPALSSSIKIHPWLEKTVNQLSTMIPVSMSPSGQDLPTWKVKSCVARSLTKRSSSTDQ
ncbi:hypothetical protein BT63DRAFT_459832 [Microthyrium microscopicum]|uniref:Uncharacterized protein n=1 Tax=Microthyrium microscopicum TaxID=703497 RepID=A0A6A6U251_9PEZI|nr:hypothetical protein BT63DRAFT_459832 [Microthyrium microscopicum]